MSTNIMRQIILDIETTGINKLSAHYHGHRIIEIGAVEIINRRITGKYFHVYLKPDRPIDLAAFKIHGISDEFLLDKPSFSDVADEFLKFIFGSELVIHNAPFDIGFIDYEFSILNRDIDKINNFCRVIDTLLLARKIFPGKLNSLSALCDRYLINKSRRMLHGALVDAKILADIFLLMTSSQTAMCFAMEPKQIKHDINKIVNKKILQCNKKSLKVIYAKDSELLAHEQYLDLIYKNSKTCLWRAVQYTFTR